MSEFLGKYDEDWTPEAERVGEDHMPESNSGYDQYVDAEEPEETYR